MSDNADMAAENTVISAPKLCARASIANSLSLMPVAALHLDRTFWALVVTNFMLMHAVWLVPPIRRQGPVQFWTFRWPLIAFAVFGNGALLLWGDRLFSVFPA